MKFVHGIGFVNSEDLLRRAVDSVRTLWPATHIIDNSSEGLNPQEWPVAVVRPPVPLTLSQTANLLANLGEQSGADAVFWMHNDAEAAEGSCDRLLAIVEDAVLTGRPWGAAFTNYDCLAAFSASALRYVGPWDVRLPHYFADVDYYRRLRLAGYEVLETGLPVRHHNKGHSTILADGGLAFLNAATIGLYRQYYIAKWGGPPHEETLDWAFDGLVANGYVQASLRQALYRELTGMHNSGHLGLLESADDRTRAAQLEVLRAEVARNRAHRIVEIGTGRSVLGFWLSRLAAGITLFTFDKDPSCAAAVELLNDSQTSVRVIFTPGDTDQSLSCFQESDIDLAWINGEGDFAVASSDINHAMRLGARAVLVNGTKVRSQMAAAVRQAMTSHPEYSGGRTPLWRNDSHGLVVLRRL